MGPGGLEAFIYLVSGRHEKGHLTVLGSWLKPPGSHAVETSQKMTMNTHWLCGQWTLKYGLAEGLYWDNTYDCTYWDVFWPMSQG